MPKPIDNTPCHYVRLRRSMENVASFYDSMLSPAGVTARQYSLLHAISTHSGCSIRELGEVTVLDRSTLARSLKPLISAGLVTDRKDPGTRSSRLVLSEQGEHTRRQAGRLWLQAQAQYEKTLGSEKLAALGDALEALQNL